MPIYDLEGAALKFDEMMSKNPIKDLWEFMARRKQVEPREGLLQELSAMQTEETVEGREEYAYACSYWGEAP